MSCYVSQINLLESVRMENDPNPLRDKSSFRFRDGGENDQIQKIARRKPNSRQAAANQWEV